MALDQQMVRWFGTLRAGDVGLVGGKNASLGELYAAMPGDGIKVPNGFAVTAAAYRRLLDEADAWGPLHALLDGLDKRDVEALARKAAAARAIVYQASGSAWLRDALAEAYRRLEAESGTEVSVAVRSSATAEDLPTASFAGQHESFLNIRGAEALFKACRNCMASIFTDRAIAYRIDNGFDHFKVALSVGVMRMIRSDQAASGVIFTLDTESGFRDVVFITGSYGIGENVVQGRIDPDEFYVHKPTFRQGYRAVLRRSLGSKEITMVHGRGAAATTHNVPTPRAKRERYCLTDAEVLGLAEAAIKIEDHYSLLAGHPMPMDIEWAKDGADGALYIVQARPETVASRLAGGMIETYRLTGTAAPLVSGKAVGERIGTGVVRVVRTGEDLAHFRPGEVLVSETTSPDWEPVMKTAAAIVTNRGGRTCHAAIVARELGVPAVVGAEGATARLATGAAVTVSCAEGDLGHVYPGTLAFEVAQIDAGTLPWPDRTRIMANLGNPDLAFRTAMLPNDGVGLARMEFIISEHIGIHPMALAHPERVSAPAVQRRIARRLKGYASGPDYFLERLSEGVGTIAAAFYPNPVIVRLSDFKTNEYASLVGGETFEPREENPMIGFRGASRYTHPAYADGFALECRALQRVRDEMGLTNLRIMVPFCRRVEEARQVLRAMAAHGLAHDRDGLEIYVMCEIPNNVIQIDAFARCFEGFSIGSNDLTQLTLGVDRDSAIVAFDFDERDPGMLEMLRLAVEGAHRNGRHVGICGEAPATYPEIAQYLVTLGIDSISVNPDSLLRTAAAVRSAETKAKRHERQTGT